MGKTASVSQEAILAAAILKVLSDASFSGLPRIEDISTLLFKMKRAGLDLGEISLRRVPGGFYSEDIEALIGHFLAAGYAEQRSPVQLTEAGREALSKIVSLEQNDNPAAMSRVQSVLERLST